MTAVAEALLALLGLIVLVLLAIAALSPNDPVPAASEDVATPYREGLHAALQMQRVAQDLEQQIYAEAARHMGGSDEPPSAQSVERK